MDKATPRPWEIDEKTYEIWGTTGDRVCSLDDERNPDANAALIVRAVNSYDAMQAALNPLAKLHIAHLESKPDSHPVFGINDTLLTLGDIRTAQAALALAGKE